MNQFLGSLALLPVEKILNTLVARDPHIANKFSRFDSKCVEIICSSPKTSLSLRFEDGEIKLSAIDCQTLGIEADATIAGSAESLLSLLLDGAEHRALANAAIDISGDALLVQ
ncbi:MAG: SCP2 sterol-binding domain-containing protein, partial [Pseudohongiellaceae bacterium]